MKKVLLISFLLLTCGLPPHQQAATILEQGLKDESIVVRVNAAKAMKASGDSEGIRILYDILNGKDKNGIVAALGALYDLGDNVYSPIIVNLTDHDDPLIRAEAFNVLSLCTDKQCIEVLIKGTKDRVAKIRRIAYLSLAKFRERDVVVRGLRDIDPLVKIAAARALGNMGDEQAANLIRKEMKIVQQDIWQEAIIALAAVADTSIRSYLRDSLVHSPDVPMTVRLAAAEGLLMFRDLAGLVVIKDALASENPFNRVQAVQILKKFNVPDATELLEQAAQDEYINVSIIAIEALARHAPGQNRELFVRMMNAPNPLVRIAAAAAYLRSE